MSSRQSDQDTLLEAAQYIECVEAGVPLWAVASTGEMVQAIQRAAAHVGSGSSSVETPRGAREGEAVASAAPEDRRPIPADAELLDILREAYTCYRNGRTEYGEYSLIQAIELVLRDGKQGEVPPVAPTASPASPVVAVSDEEVRDAIQTYSATFLANRPEQHGKPMGLKEHNAANEAAFRAVLESFLSARREGQ